MIWCNESHFIQGGTKMTFLTITHKSICKNCGLSYDAHLGTSYYSEQYEQSFPSNTCPGHEGRMDWNNGPGTVFEPSGKSEDVKYNTPAKGVKE